MRVVITGATGNVGSALVEALADDPEVDSVLGLARRPPQLAIDKVQWRRADIVSDDLEPLMRGADAVVHLAWAIQPSRAEDVLRATNVDGSARVFEAVASAGVPALVYASSVGVYSPGPKDRRVDESWPTGGIESLFYSRHKVEVEAYLDRFESRHRSMRIVRLRPGLIFRAEAASGIRRLFLGPLFPRWLAAADRIPIVPDVPSLRFQAVHADDVAQAYRLALHSDAFGAFNVAADPVIGVEELAELLDARPVPVAARLLRAAAELTWRLRLQPTPAGWLDLALLVPLMSSRRAAEELSWTPRFTSQEALVDLIAGLRSGRGLATPPLAADSGGVGRWREFASGVGGR